MSANDIHINSVAPMSQKPNELPTAPVVSPAKSKSDVKPVSTVSIHDIRRMTEIKKDESLNEISENVEAIREAIKALNDAMKEASTNLHFSVDDNSNRYVVKVQDSSTGEIIRSVPGEAILRMARQIESLKGILFDDKY